MNVIAWRVVGNDERSVLKPFQRDFPLFGEFVCGRNYSVKFVIHDRQELITLILLVTDESNVDPSVFNPLCQIALGSFDDFETDIGITFLKFADNLRNPVDRTAEICADTDRADLCTFQ